MNSWDSGQNHSGWGEQFLTARRCGDNAEEIAQNEGKDEEVRKAEDLCQEVREKLDQKEKLTKDLKAEIEHLQRRMTELEKLEEAFGKKQVRLYPVVP